MPQQPIRQGDIYRIDQCPPLDGGTAKDNRPVVVIAPPGFLSDGEVLVAVACTSTPTSELLAEAIELPSQATIPNCKTGLDKQTWAVPRWVVPVRVERLPGERSGFVSGQKLARIVDAAASHLERIIAKGE